MKQATDFLKRMGNPNYFPWIILIFSFALRISFAATHLSFAQDQARDVMLMEQFKENGQIFVGYGPKASVGDFYLPPLYYQVHYWFSLITGNHPFTMHWVITIVESFTPLLVYLIVKRLLSPQYGLLAATLYIFSPLALSFGTFAWNPNMIPFFSTLALWAWLRYLEEWQPNYIIVGTVAVTIAFHLHYQAFVLIPFLLIMAFYSFQKQRSHIKFWLLSGVLVLLTLAPYFAAEIQSNWQNTQGIVAYFTTEHTRTYERVTKPEYVLSFLPGFTERTLVGGNRDFIWIGRLVFWLGLALLAYYAVSRKKYWFWITLYFFTLFIMFRVYKGDKIDYYLSTLFILPPLLTTLIAKQLPKLSLVFLLIIGFYAGKDLSAKPASNGLEKLNQAVTYIENQLPENQAHFIFHNQEHINTFRYGFHHSNISVNENSQYFVDICPTGRPCAWNGALACQTPKEYNASILEKVDRNYQFIHQKKFPTYHIVIGQINTR